MRRIIPKTICQSKLREMEVSGNMENKKTVATITYHRSDNFGSVLQAYALGEKLRQMGYEQFNIDYRRKEVAQVYQIFQPLTSKFNVITNCYHLLHYAPLKRRQRRYEQFRQKWLRLSRVYSEKRDLMENPPAADAYITGSDQVWGTRLKDYDDSFVLDFVKQGRKISYAASGINRHTTEETLEPIKKHVVSFDGVSVRENLIRERLETVCPVSVRIDPVLLLQKRDWEKLCTPQKRKKPFMLCYFAGGVSAAFEAFTRQKAAELGLERVILMPEWRNLFRSGCNCYDAGPEEFVSLIQQADLICTNSFHGTAFSVLLNKPFLVGQAEPFQDDRIGTLLGTVGLKEREIDPAHPVLPELLEIDFTEVNQKLAQLRQRDADWLRQQIEGE